MIPAPSPERRKLTLDDLDRFLAVPAVDAGLSPYCDAAAVLAVFDPLALRSTEGKAASDGDVLGRLRPLCELVTDSGDTSCWTLTICERRAAFTRLRTRDRMRAALSANPDRERGALQRALETVLEGRPIPLETLSRDDLASLVTVHGWLEGILDGLPDPIAIAKAIRRIDLLAPMRRLTAAGFVGREKELERLREFVFGPPPVAPLFVFGPGGVGKSTLLAEFMLTQVEAHDLPIAYLDIDRPTIRPERPATLLLDALGQLQPQLGVAVEQIEPVAKELEYALHRHESGRHLESASPGDWTTGLFADGITRWAGGRPLLIVIDTVEEAQFLGPDVMEPFAWFAMDLQRRAPAARVVLSGRTLPLEYLGHAFPEVLHARANVDDPWRLDLVPEPQRPISLDVLEQAPARELLRTSLAAAGMPALSDQDVDEVIGIVSRNPMCLKLAARLLRDEGIRALGEDRATLLTRLRAEKIQALLYGRILRHLHGDDVRSVAYPGLVVRRIDEGVVEHVLAGPCGLTFDDRRTPASIVRDLAREAALVEVDPADGSLRHRADVRRAMLEDLTDYVDASVVRTIDENAVAHYQRQSGVIARGEEIYHRLRLHEPFSTIGARWNEGAGQRLKGAVDELPPEQRLWLAERLGVTLDESVRRSADQAAWEAQAARSVDRYLVSRSPADALKVLGERPDRLPRSALFGLEAEVHRFMGRPDDALAVARRGVESATAAGAIDMALELLLRMVVIEEGRGSLAAATSLLQEAAAVAAHSVNRLLRFRVAITALRLQRQVQPESRAERAEMRRQAIEMLDDWTLRRLRDHPVLLREAAAELAKQDPRLAAAAIETLGIEVASDEQAKAFGRALAGAAKNMSRAAGSKLDDALAALEASDFDADTVRRWATEALTSRDTRRLGSELAGRKAGDWILSRFRDYFRAGVTSALSIDPSRLRTK